MERIKKTHNTSCTSWKLSSLSKRYYRGKEAVSRNIHGGALAKERESSFNWDSNYKAKNVTDWQSTG